jgi:hypothetical protein
LQNKYKTFDLNAQKMNLDQRINLLVQLGEYIKTNQDEWTIVKEKASIKNPWFTIPFIDLATQNIAHFFLTRDNLQNFTSRYPIPDTSSQKKVGIIMAGNIPAVGFHDFLCGFLSGHTLVIKLSDKDNILMAHFVEKMTVWDSSMKDYIRFADMLTGCDAYIATGSNNSSRYFDYYFGKYPHIIRKNKTSVAILTGDESADDLDQLADDVHLFFGLGCRNVTKLFVPEGYNFEPLIQAFKRFDYFAEHHKFKNNYDYYLAILILNNVFYMTGNSVLLVENESIFSPLSQLNYGFYKNQTELESLLNNNEDIQCIVGQKFIPFGKAQEPAIDQFADGVDTMLFLTNLYDNQ